MITKQKFLEKKDFYLKEIKAWKIFIYPTDTILWIGTKISNFEGVDKILELKQREEKPLLIIVPNIEWIEENCILTPKNKSFIQSKLPGAYSFILKLKNKTNIYSKINWNSDSIWIRMPNNWFFDIIKELGEPFITTSVNISWEPSIIDIKKIPKNILKWVDYVVENENNLNASSSMIIDLRWTQNIILRN